MQPYVLLWLRYTAFIVLYPLGVASELTMVALAMPYIKEQRPLSIQVGRCARCGGPDMAEPTCGCWLLLRGARQAASRRLPLESGWQAAGCCHLTSVPSLEQPTTPLLHIATPPLWSAPLPNADAQRAQHWL